MKLELHDAPQTFGKSRRDAQHAYVVRGRGARPGAVLDHPSLAGRQSIGLGWVGRELFWALPEARPARADFRIASILNAASATPG